MNPVPPSPSGPSSGPDRPLSELSSAVLLERWCAGDQDAAGEVYDRYAGRLVHLLVPRISEKLGPRFGPDDLVQTALGSLFQGVRQGRYGLEHGHSLWPLLVKLAMKKLKREVKRHRAGIRDVRREQRPGDTASPNLLESLADRATPAPEVEVALKETLETLLARLRPNHRHMVLMRLTGHSSRQIGQALGCSDRAVRMVLAERVGPYLEQLLAEDEHP